MLEFGGLLAVVVLAAFSVYALSIILRALQGGGE